MTKITIKAASVTLTMVGDTHKLDVANPEITIEGTKVGADAKLPDLLRSLLAKAMGQGGAADDDAEGDDQAPGMLDADAVVDHVRDNPGVSIEQVAEHFKVDEGFATHVLAFLSASGVLDDTRGDATVTFTVAGDTASTEGLTGTADIADEADEADEADDTPATTDEVLAFLRSDDRFEYRTYARVRTHFGNRDPWQAMANLVDSGTVTVKYRRADGSTLYKAAAVPTEVTSAGQAETKPELTIDNVCRFLNSDPRYTERTVAAIAKHFGVAEDDRELAVVLADGYSGDDLEHTHRRRDGADLYAAA